MTTVEIQRDGPRVVLFETSTLAVVGRVIDMLSLFKCHSFAIHFSSKCRLQLVPSLFQSLSDLSEVTQQVLWNDLHHWLSTPISEAHRHPKVLWER